MSKTFIKIGDHWLNLDLVTRVELVPDRQDPSKTEFAKVHFVTGGEPHVFSEAAEVETLAEWLRKHKAR